MLAVVWKSSQTGNGLTGELQSVHQCIGLPSSSFRSATLSHFVHLHPLSTNRIGQIISIPLLNGSSIFSPESRHRVCQALKEDLDAGLLYLLDGQLVDMNGDQLFGSSSIVTARSAGDAFHSSADELLRRIRICSILFTQINSFHALRSFKYCDRNNSSTLERRELKIGLLTIVKLLNKGQPHSSWSPW